MLLLTSPTHLALPSSVAPTPMGFSLLCPVPAPSRAQFVVVGTGDNYLSLQFRCTTFFVGLLGWVLKCWATSSQMQMDINCSGPPLQMVGIILPKSSFALLVSPTSHTFVCHWSECSIAMTAALLVHPSSLSCGLPRALLLGINAHIKTTPQAAWWAILHRLGTKARPLRRL